MALQNWPILAGGSNWTVVVKGGHMLQYASQIEVGGRSASKCVFKGTKWGVGNIHRGPEHMFVSYRLHFIL